MIGTASAPNATGAVLATRATAAALSGRNPSAISMTELIATGVPNPASASISAPKQNAMIIAWMRWSSLIEANDRRSTSKCPVSTVRLYTQIALMTIHMIGKRPKAAPSSPAVQRVPHRHRVGEDRDEQGDQQADQGGEPRAHPHDAQQDEQHRQGQRGHERGQSQRTGNRVLYLAIRSEQHLTTPLK